MPTIWGTLIFSSIVFDKSHRNNQDIKAKQPGIVKGISTILVPVTKPAKKLKLIYTNRR